MRIYELMSALSGQVSADKRFCGKCVNKNIQQIENLTMLIVKHYIYINIIKSEIIYALCNKCHQRKNGSG